jgi:hypothetical protein
MTEVPGTPPTKGATSLVAAPAHHAAPIRTVLFILIAVVALVWESRDLITAITDPHPPPLEAVREAVKQHDAILSIPVMGVDQEITGYIASCDYHFVVICQKAVDPCDQAGETNLQQTACRLSQGAPFGSAPLKHPGPLDYLWGAALMVVRFPDAAFHMLANRWGAGPTSFMTGVFFVLAYVTTVVVVLRQKFPINVYLGVFAILGGLPVLLDLFSLLQNVLAQAAPAATVYVAMAMTAFGVPFCLFCCIGHGVRSVGESLGIVAGWFRA